MPTPAKKASTPRQSPAKSPAASAPEDYSDTVKDVVIDVLLRRAFPHAQWANVGDWLEQQSLAPEVKAEIRAAVERNR